MKKYVFLVNTFSLKERTNEIIEGIEEASKKLKFKYIIETNNDKRSTEDILDSYKNKKETIIVVGGDGIINRALNKLIDTKNTLGFIPCGTGNDFNRYCRENFIKGSNLCDVLKINDKYFINIGCFGIDADIANNADFKSKLIPRKQRYNASIIKHFAKYNLKKFTVLVNNEKYEKEFCTIIVGNAKYYGKGYTINPKGKVDDGKFELFLIDKMSRLKFALLINRVKAGKHENNKHVKKIITDKAIIKCDQEVTANLDGEELTSKTFEIELLPKKINIFYDRDLIGLIKNYKKR